LKKILIIGAGGHSRSCIDVIQETREYDIVGIIGHAEEIGKNIYGIPILGSDDDLLNYLSICQYACIAIGHMGDPKIRINMIQKLLKIGYELPSIISPMAYISKNSEVGLGSMVMHGAIVNSGAHIGNNCIINSMALIEHDVIVEDHVHISTAAVINGGAKIGEGSFIGSGSKIKNLMSVPKYSYVKMGSIVK